MRFYQGQKDKTLVQRHRQDDPIWWIPESLFSIVNNLTTLPVPPATPAPPPLDGEGCQIEC